MKLQKLRTYLLILIILFSTPTFSQIGIGDMFLILNSNSENFQTFYTKKGYKLNSYKDEENITGIDVIKTHKGTFTQIIFYTRYFNKGKKVFYRIVDDSNLFLKFKEELPKYGFTIFNNKIGEVEGRKYEEFKYVNRKNETELDISISPPSDGEKWISYEIGLSKIQNSEKIYSYLLNESGDSVSLKISNEDYQWLENSQIVSDWKDNLTKEYWGEYDNKKKEFEKDVVSFFLKKCLIEVWTNTFFKTTKIEGKDGSIFGKGYVSRNQSGINVEVYYKSYKDKELLLYKLIQIYKNKFGKWETELVVEEVK